MGPYLILPFRVKVDMRTIAIKEYSKLLKAPGVEPHQQMLFSVISRSVVVGFLSSIEMQLAYSPALAD